MLLEKRIWFVSDLLFLLPLLLVVACEAPTSSRKQKKPPASEPSHEIQKENLRSDVYFLSAPEFQGRGPNSDERVLSSKYIANQFRKSGLVPVRKPGEGNSPLDGYRQPIKNNNDEVIGYNVLGWLPGKPVGSTRKDAIVVNAHFDHLGTRNNGKDVYYGADDNASGVAVVLAMVRYLTSFDRPFKRPILFACFDLEEQGLVGSSYFVKHPIPVPRKRLGVFVNFDMVGRNFLGELSSHLFSIGYEHSPELHRIATNIAEGYDSLALRKVGSDVTGRRSDFVPFKRAEIPFIWFSAGTHSDYHTPDDTPDKLDYEQTEAVAQLSADLVKKLATGKKLPDFNKEPRYSIEEVSGIREVLDRIVNKSDAIGLSKFVVNQVKKFRDRLKKIEKKGSVSSKTRSAIVQNARQMIRLFQSGR